MSTPPFLFGATLLLWGWQIGWLAVAAPLAIAVELPRWTPTRWEFSQLELDRVWNLCAGLFFALIAYLFGSNDHGLGLLQAADVETAMRQAVTRGTAISLLFFQWAPLTLLPILLAQIWGTRIRLPYSTFSWFLQRRIRGANRKGPEPGMNITWPVFGVFVLGAGAGGKADYFLPCAGLFAAWALWPSRNRGYGIGAWIGALLLAAGLAAGMQLAMRPVVAWLQHLENELLNRGQGGGFDAAETRTQLGRIGELKTSGRIVLRVETPEGGEPPELLREAGYSVLRGATWHAGSREFESLEGGSAESAWTVAPGRGTERTVKIWAPLRQGRGLLPAPLGSVRLWDLPALKLETNAMGALRAQGLSLAGFTAAYDPSAAWDGEPGEADLSIPEAEAGALNEVVRELGVSAGIPSAEALRAAAGFFAAHFSYTLDLGRDFEARTNQTALGRFLLRDRRGHCEFFATAGTLLLRHLGVPARYMAGWSVQEKRGNQYIVRARHAHAWTLAWVDGAWREVDFTPGGWGERERELGSSFEFLGDAWSHLVFMAQRFRHGSGSGLRRWLLIPAAGILVLAAGQLFRRGSWRRRKAGAAKGASARHWPGLESGFYALESRLRTLGFERRPDEPLLQWWSRLPPDLPGSKEALREIVRRHYQFRFDPAGFDEGQRAELRRCCEDFMAVLDCYPR